MLQLPIGTRYASSFVVGSLFLVSGAATASASSPLQDLDYTFDSTASSITLNTDVLMDLTGDLKGVYDAMTNPGGTRTVLGIFGDNGLNNEVPVTITLGIAAAIGGALDGTFEFNYDAGLGAVVVENLAATVGAAGSSAADLTVTLTYDTFRSINPGSVYIGGFPLAIPLGSVAVTDVVLVQSAPGGGTATAGVAGLVDLIAAVPVELSFNVDLAAFGGGGVTPVGPLPVLMPLNGTFDLADCATGLVAAGDGATMQTLPSPFPFALTDLALPLPTVFPAGNTADLLLNATLDSVTVDGTVATRVVASADPAGRTVVLCDGQPNSSGLGGVLGTTGSTSVGSADLVLVATELPLQSLGYMLMSQTADSVPGFGGSQGTLCLGGSIYRFSLSVQNSGMLGEVSFAPDFGALPVGQQFLAAESWNFQYWFRDANPGPTSNTTSAVRVTFCH